MLLGQVWVRDTRCADRWRLGHVLIALKIARRRMVHRSRTWHGTRWLRVAVPRRVASRRCMPVLLDRTRSVWMWVARARKRIASAVRSHGSSRSGSRVGGPSGRRARAGRAHVIVAGELLQGRRLWTTVGSVGCLSTVGGRRGKGSAMSWMELARHGSSGRCVDGLRLVVKRVGRDGLDGRRWQWVVLLVLLLLLQLLSLCKLMMLQELLLCWRLLLLRTCSRRFASSS